MKKLLTTSLLLASYLSLYAQGSNVTIYTEEGAKFTLYVNGEKMNNYPDTRVAAVDIVSEVVRLKLVFVDEQTPPLTKTVMFEPNMEYNALIKKNKKGKYVMRSDLGTPIQRQSIAEKQNMEPAAQPSTQTQETITTTSTTTTVPNEISTGVDMNISESTTGVNVSMNVSINDNISAIESTSSETTVTTTSTSSSYDSEQKDVTGCTSAMMASKYDKVKESISSKPFADEKMIVAKQVLKSTCVSVDQVIGLMGLFTYEEEKLALAKLAYAKTINQDDYYQVNDAFTYSDSIEQLDAFLSSQ